MTSLTCPNDDIADLDGLGEGIIRRAVVHNHHGMDELLQFGIELVDGVTRLSGLSL